MRTSPLTFLLVQKCLCVSISRGKPLLYFLLNIGYPLRPSRRVPSSSSSVRPSVASSVPASVRPVARLIITCMTSRSIRRMRKEIYPKTLDKHILEPSPPATRRFLFSCVRVFRSLRALVTYTRQVSTHVHCVLLFSAGKHTPRYDKQSATQSQPSAAGAAGGNLTKTLFPGSFSQSLVSRSSKFFVE